RGGARPGGSSPSPTPRSPRVRDRRGAASSRPCPACPTAGRRPRASPSFSVPAPPCSRARRPAGRPPPARARACPGPPSPHSATHGLAAPVSPLASALVLAPATDASGRRDDGLLQAWEVVQDLRLEADLVALSACESGSGAAVADEGLIGLTRAFHFAGARAGLASLWKVYDRSASTLLDGFYTHL